VAEPLDVDPIVEARPRTPGATHRIRRRWRRPC